MRIRVFTFAFCFFATCSALQAQMVAHVINVGQASSTLMEFPTGALLIDAGGESRPDDADLNHLLGTLETFFARRTDLHRTLNSVIITHPHIDHTRFLNEVLQAFNVKALIDTGGTTGSGIVPLRSARAFAQTHGIKYEAVTDQKAQPNGRTDRTIDPFSHSGDPNIRILSGGRGCKNENNDSLVIRIIFQAKTLIVTGDAENTNETGCSGEIGLLLDRYSAETTLNADVYIAGHHGSGNGTTDALLLAITPEIAVISAGPQDRRGLFTGFHYGHPRQVAVQLLDQRVTSMRPPKDVYVMRGQDDPLPVTMRKAVYCTCWDGDITITFAEPITVSTTQ